MPTFSSRRGIEPATLLQVRPLGRSAERTPFELYVPNLLVFAMIMLVFSSAMVTAREVERGTLERLRLTRMRPGEWLAGTAIAQTLLGTCSVALTFIFAMGSASPPDRQRCRSPQALPC